jgi:hypothetical protein
MSRCLLVSKEFTFAFLSFNVEQRKRANEPEKRKKEEKKSCVMFIYLNETAQNFQLFREKRSVSQADPLHSQELFLSRLINGLLKGRWSRLELTRKLLG